MAATGQTINDRLNAVRYALFGQGLARTVCKSTTEEVLGPKKKHIDYLIACTNEPNVSIPQLANLLIERTQHMSWAVVFKSLISIHHLMSYGNERFTQYLATSNHSFDLSDFMDRTTPQGYNMSTFVRHYAKYINDKTLSYRTLAIDLCKIGRGNDNALRTMNMENLSKTMPIVQTQFDSLLEFAAEQKDLNNGIIMSAFRLLYKDLVKLYVAYQEAIINLLERYFKLSRKKTREALDMYKKYLSRMDKVANFLRVVDAVGLDKSEMPDLTDSPPSILKLLEQHLAQLEAKKRGATPASPENDDEEEKEETSLADPGSSSTKPNKALETQPAEPKGPSKTNNEPERRANPERPITPKKTPPPSEPPKLPPAKPAPPPVAAGSATATSPAVPSAEKKGPPERPAKPPSRPPPPSAQPVATGSTSPSSAGEEPTTTTVKAASLAPPPRPIVAASPVIPAPSATPPPEEAPAALQSPEHEAASSRQVVVTPPPELAPPALSDEVNGAFSNSDDASMTPAEESTSTANSSQQEPQVSPHSAPSCSANALEAAQSVAEHAEIVEAPVENLEPEVVEINHQDVQNGNGREEDDGEVEMNHVAS